MVIATTEIPEKNPTITPVGVTKQAGENTDKNFSATGSQAKVLNVAQPNTPAGN